ncbi:MAG: transcription antitermination factor NusB [Clostridiales bacterium]|nr:transcription antitermination factor NusB [Clostridiales bacterium]
MMRPLFARAHALKCLYAAEYTEVGSPAALWDEFADAGADTIRPSNRELAFIEKLILGVQTHAEELDARIAERAEGWRVERISRVDLCILRMAVYELLYCRDTPKGAVINEAVELCKLYGDGNSFRFVNGILGSIVRSPEPTVGAQYIAPSRSTDNLDMENDPAETIPPDPTDQ